MASEEKDDRVGMYKRAMARMMGKHREEKEYYRKCLDNQAEMHKETMARMGEHQKEELEYYKKCLDDRNVERWLKLADPKYDGVADVADARRKLGIYTFIDQDESIDPKRLPWWMTSASGRELLEMTPDWKLKIKTIYIQDAEFLQVEPWKSRIHSLHQQTNPYIFYWIMQLWEKLNRLTCEKHIDKWEKDHPRDYVVEMSWETPL